MNASTNPSRRLSGSSKSRVLVTGPSNLQRQGLRVIEDWSQLLDQSNAPNAVGLKETNPLDSIFALKPAVLGERGFDAVTQVFMWTLADSQQRPLHIEIGFEEFTEPAIKFLEDVPPESLQGALVIGRIQRTPQGLSLHPYSIHRQSGEIIHLCLDNVMPAAARANPVQNEEEESFEDEEDTELPTAFSPALSRLLDEVDDGLLALAEAGLATPNPLRVERVRQVALRAERLGLQGLTSGLSNVANHPRSVAVLRCAYLSQLHRRAMPLSV